LKSQACGGSPGVSIQESDSQMLVYKGHLRAQALDVASTFTKSSEVSTKVRMLTDHLATPETDFQLTCSKLRHLD
jgi:hypothetical protein